jgi:hypothetical protein
MTKAQLGLAVKGEDAGPQDPQEDRRAEFRYAEAPRGVGSAALVGSAHSHLSFTSSEIDGWARKLPGFTSCSRTDVRPLSSFPQLPEDASNAQCDRPFDRSRRVKLMLTQKLIVGLSAGQHRGITMARLALSAMGRFRLIKRRREQLESLLGEASPLVKKSRASEGKGRDVQALEMMVQLAGEMRCHPSLSLELKRMPRVRSVDPSARPIACRFIWNGLSSCVV